MCFHRGIAVSEWAGLRSRGAANSLERALGAFDLFIPGGGYGDLNEVCGLSI
jgi:F-box protein 21